jgi:pentatricopeptide repeat protein
MWRFAAVPRSQMRVSRLRHFSQIIAPQIATFDNVNMSISVPQPRQRAKTTTTPTVHFEQPECALYNEMLQKIVDKGDCQQALKVFYKMKDSGVDPNTHTYDLITSVLLKADHPMENFRMIFDHTGPLLAKLSPTALNRNHESEKLFQLWSDQVGFISSNKLPKTTNFFIIKSNNLVDMSYYTQLMESKGTTLDRPTEVLQQEDDAFLRQLVLEKRAVDISAEKYREVVKQEFTDGRGANLAATQRLIANWFPGLVAAIEVGPKTC